MSSKKQVLIIEDDEKLSQIFAYALRALDFDILTAADGRVAQTQLRSTAPDLILLDLHLPNVSGPALLEEIDHDGRHHNTKVIIATADVQLAEQLSGMADHILHKPISVLNLQKVVRQLFALSDSR